MKYNFWNDTLPESRIDKIVRQDPMILLRRAIETPRDAITIGEDLRTGRDVRLSLKEHLGTHLHICGATGTGKTRGGVELIVKHLIINPARGGCLLLTPHDDVFRQTLEYCAHLHMKRPELRLHERVIPIDFDDPRRIVGFNVAARNARTFSYQVATFVDSILKCWGQSDLHQTPRLARWLFNASHAVVEAGLTMVQAKRLVDNKPHPLRDAIVRRIQDPDIRAEWQYVMGPTFRRPGADDPLESALNRLRDFCSNELIRLSLGQYTHTLDIPKVVREDKILLVNLDARNAISDSNRNLYGTLLISELLTAAFARKPAYRKPFYLLVDEAQFFMTSDMCPILDGGRKFGLRCVLAHQHLGQFREKHPDVYMSLISNARSKLVFGGMSDDDLDVMAKELYVGELDPDEVKDEIWQTKYALVESNRIVVSDSESEGGSDSYSEITNQSLVESASFYADSGFINPDNPHTVAEASGSGQGTAEAHGSSWGRSRAETRMPFIEHHPFQELSSRQFRSLEEQLYIRKAQLKRQQRQHAALLVPGQHVQLIRTPDLREFHVAERHVDDFKHACWEAAGCFARPEEAEAQIAALEAKLLAPPTIEVATERSPHQPDDDDSDYDEG